MPDASRDPPGPPPSSGDDAARTTLRAAVIRAQAATLARREQELERLEAGAEAGLWSCRLRDAALDWSGGVYDLFGIPRGTALSRSRIVAMYEPASQRLLEALRARAIGIRSPFTLDAEIATPRGERRWIRIRAEVETGDGRATRIFGTKRDVTREVERLSELSRRADRDVLTALPNRRAFEARFHRGEPPGALLLVDLDGFKAVNDTRGHAAGDACIREAAARLARVCRGTDLVARIGGDEFAVLVPAPIEPRGLEILGRRIVEALSRPFDLSGAPVRIGASVGIAQSGPGCAPGSLFARADAALYAAKAGGRNAVRIDGEAG